LCLRIENVSYFDSVVGAHSVYKHSLTFSLRLAKHSGGGSTDLSSVFLFKIERSGCACRIPLSVNVSACERLLACDRPG
jgi:hypothetical protein